MVRPIITDIAELIMPCERTTNSDMVHNGHWDDMYDTLMAHPSGIAIAANQIGIQKQAFMIVVRHTSGTPPIVMKYVNPVIETFDHEFIFVGDGCLSFPGRRINTRRYGKITVRDNINGIQELNGLMAVVVQHEIDHLSGWTMFDREDGKNTDLKCERQEPNEKCKCGSGRKYKKCHGR